MCCGLQFKIFHKLEQNEEWICIAHKYPSALHTCQCPAPVDLQKKNNCILQWISVGWRYTGLVSREFERKFLEFDRRPFADVTFWVSLRRICCGTFQMCPSARCTDILTVSLAIFSSNIHDVILIDKVSFWDETYLFVYVILKLPPANLEYHWRF